MFLRTTRPSSTIEISGEIASDPGHLRHWLASYYPVHLDDEVIGVGVVVVDVTERRQAEDFRSIVMNNMAEGLYTVDAHGRLTSMNAAATKMLGWTEKELLGTEMRDLVLAQELATNRSKRETESSCRFEAKVAMFVWTTTPTAARTVRFCRLPYPPRHS